MVKNPPASAGDIRDVGSVPGLGRFPGGGLGNALQYFCLENRMEPSELYSPWGRKESVMTEVTYHSRMQTLNMRNHKKHQSRPCVISSPERLSFFSFFFSLKRENQMHPEDTYGSCVIIVKLGTRHSNFFAHRL